MEWALWGLGVVVAYLLGAVPFGLVVAKTLRGVDPRESGSRNIGATNVARTCGTKFGVLTLALDILKGAVPVAVAVVVDGHWAAVSLVALAAVAGHVFPVFLGFKGGKAVATTIGVFLPIAFLPLLASAGLCAAAIAISGYVSLGSLTLVTALPVLILVWGEAIYLPLALVVMALVYWRHRENIARLVKGEEKSWRKGKTSSAKSEPASKSDPSDPPANS
jgi:acyl phosphate:glycerol-3-phosphate acyltransferase